MGVLRYGHLLVGSRCYSALACPVIDHFLTSGSAATMVRSAMVGVSTD